MRMFYLALLFVGCGVYEEGSDVEFIGYEHIGRGNRYGGFLISKVHQDKMTVGYHFGDKCNYSVFSKKDLATLETDIKDMLRVWLDAVRELPSVERDVVRKIVTQNVTGEHRFREITSKLDLVVEFTCERGWPFAKTGNGNQEGLIYPPVIVMNTLWGDLIVDKPEYSLPALLHEMGHSMGLVDTYAQNNRSVRGGAGRYFSGTIGNQPPSIMSGNQFFLYHNTYQSITILPPYRIKPRQQFEEIKRNISVLSEDDRRGLEWLYVNYFRRGETENVNDCYFPDYELEELGYDKKGCVPTNMLIYMIKNGYTQLIQEELTWGKNWGKNLGELINKREKVGNRLYPSHYLSMMPNDEGAPILNILRLSVDANVTDEIDQTPLHYAIKARNSGSARILLANPSLIIDKKLPNKMSYLHFAIQLADVGATCLILHRPYGAINESSVDRWGLTARQRANLRLNYWEGKGNKRMIANMRYIISVLKNRTSSSLCSNLTFLLKIGHLEAVIGYVQRNDGNTDMLAKKEKRGNGLSAWHYIALIPGNKGADIFLLDNLNYPIRNVDVADNRGQTPLHYAIRAGNKKVAHFLINALVSNGDFESDTEGFKRILPNGMTYLHYTAQFADALSTCHLLNIVDFDLSVKDSWGLTAEQRATSRLSYWKNQNNQQMVGRTQQIISMLKDPSTVRGWDCKSVLGIGWEEW